VTSGARQKDEEWNPEENGGFAIHGQSHFPSFFFSYDASVKLTMNRTPSFGG